MITITKTETLASACQRLADNDYITVDTEFMREGTFWPELCLIQIAGGQDDVLVDPLAPGLDLAPFFELMANQRVLKVFHAARQDIEIVHHLAGIIPQPVFDTQVAAMVCGFGESVSYANLVSKVLKEDLDKGQRFTDWRRRPLSDKQLVYALGDVTFLRPIYEFLAAELERSNRAGWLAEEMAVLTDPATYISHPEDAWQRLKLRVRSQKALAILIELADWRERAAQSQDVPRNRILRDEVIYDLANQAPDTPEKLAELRTLNDGFARSQRGREVLSVIKRALKRDRDTLPKLSRSEPLSAQESAIMDLLRVFLKACAAEHGVASKILATTDDLEAIARSDEADVPALKGWRRELFGNDALALKAGGVGLTVKRGNVVTIKL